MFSYQFHIRDYLTKTRHLSLIEDLAYRRLLDTYYTEEQPLPVDPVRCARLIAMPEHAEAVELVLNEFFTLANEGWVNERADLEITKYHAKADSARKANAKRWESKTEQKPDVKPDLVPDANQIATINHKPRTNKPILGDEGFASFWSAYPRKVSKAEAQKAFAKVNPDETLLATILSAVERAKASKDWTKDDGQFIPHASTWLNQRRWEDEVAIGADDPAGGDWL